MAEQYPSDADLIARSGLTECEQEVLYPAIGESPYYVSFYRMLDRLIATARRAGDLRVFKDGALSFGVRAGRFSNGSDAIHFAGAQQQPLTDGATSAIWLSPDGALSVSAEGFPDPESQPHLPLAEIVTSGGDYAAADIVDHRGRCLLRPLAGLSAELERGLAGRLPLVPVSAGEQVGTVREIVLQVCDARQQPLAGRFVVRVWIATSDGGAPDGSGQAVAVTAGTAVQAIAPNGHLIVASDAAGRVVLEVSVAGAASRYVMCEIGGIVSSSGEVAWI